MVGEKIFFAACGQLSIWVFWLARREGQKRVADRAHCSREIGIPCGSELIREKILQAIEMYRPYWPIANEFAPTGLARCQALPISGICSHPSRPLFLGSLPYRISVFQRGWMPHGKFAGDEGSVAQRLLEVELGRRCGLENTQPGGTGFSVFSREIPFAEMDQYFRAHLVS